jgi:Raf kinase inhibitor-like YbhB/YbcL family protein
MPQELNVADLKLSSPAFAHHKRIPDRHTTDAENISPALEWSGAPEGTKSFAIAVDDPDAPLINGFTHWIAYGIPGDATGVPEGADKLTEGTNSMGETGYVGPAPPPGHGVHHYFFWVFALDSELDLEPGLDRRAFADRIEDHIIEQARLVGTYDR